MPDLKARLEDYQRLIAIAADLASTLDLSSLLQRIAYAAKDIAEAEAASILLYDERAKELYFQVATNIDEPTMRGLVVPLEGSVAGWVLRSGEIMRVDDASTDSRVYHAVSQTTNFPTRSLLALPMTTKDKTVGVLEILNKLDGSFTDVDVHLLTVLSGQAAIAIENARLFQQFDLISEFVHELRTPLASLSTATYLLMRPELAEDQRMDIIKNLHKETLRLNDLASSFLDLSRLESGRVQFDLQPVNLNELFDDVFGVMRTHALQEEVHLEKDVDENAPLIQADYNRLKQALLNLVSNAIKYNRPGGSVTLAARFDEQMVHLFVRDTGMGIPADAVPHLFEKFYRVKKTQNKAIGTGLGLAITKKIVEGHGGRIEVRSESGRGTEFILHLPRRGAAET